jgi:hypothetical protein
MLKATSLALLAALSGCALFPLSEAECKGVNWQQRGYADGYGGHPQQYSRLSSECKQRYGVDVDQAAYFKGWRDGYDEWDRLWGSMDKRR